MNAIQLNIDAADWQKQVNKAVKTLEKLTYNFEQEQRAILEDCAVPMVDAMQAGAPTGTKIHIRYPRSRGGRAKSGEGTRVAKYYPGNLKGAFRVLDLKRAKGVIVGAKLARSGTKGTFGKSRFDAYYLHWVEYGTVNMAAKPFVRPAIIRTSPRVINRMKKNMDRFAAKFARQNRA
jgi:HK97 gp10 family phage protein